MKKNRLLTLILICMMFGIGLNAQVPTFNWAKQIGSTGSDNGNSIVTSGNYIYTTGSFNGTVDFNPGGTPFTLYSVVQGAYVCKYTSAGALVWAKQLGNTATGNSITVDGNGDVLITGYYLSNGDFDPGSGVVTLTSLSMTEDIFVCKLTTNGDFVWAKSLGGSLGADHGNSIKTDASNNVYIGGYFRGTADFDPGAGTVNLQTAGGTNYMAGFLVKLNNLGDLVWADGYLASFSLYGVSNIKSIALDPAGDIYTTGDFYGTLDFDPGAGTQNLTSAGNSDIFVTKINSSGVLQWCKGHGAAGNDYANAIVATNTRVCSTGSFSGTVVFNSLEAGATTCVSNGQTDIYFMRTDATSGYVNMATSYGGTGVDEGKSIAKDASNNYYLTGSFQNTVDFESWTGITNLTSNGNSDIFILCEDNYSTFRWVKSMGGTGNDFGTSIAISGYNNVYTTGSFIGTVWFGVGATLFSAGLEDIFIHKLNQCVNPTVTGTDIVSACGNSYTWIDGLSYTSNNNTATFTIPSAEGCDSIVTLNLTLIPTVYSTSNITKCFGDSALIGGIYYLTSGTYLDTLTSGLGCDSIVTTVLTVNPLLVPVITNSALTFCSGIGCTLSTGAYASYNWIHSDGGGDWLVLGNTQSININNYNPPLILEVVDSNGCTGTSLDFTATFTTFASEPVSITIADVTDAPINIATGGTASASSSYYNVTDPDRAFDGDLLTDWGGDGVLNLPDWLEYDLGAGNAQSINAYSIYIGGDDWGYNYMPTAWIFEGFNGTTWDTLDVQTAVSLTPDTYNIFPISSTVSYQRYRLYITAGLSTNYANITELQLLQYPQPSCTDKVFLATTTGIDLTYQWYVNGIASGIDSSLHYSSALIYNDAVSCVVSSTYQCAGTNNPATSNTVFAQNLPMEITQTFVENTGFSVTVGTNTYTTTGIYTDILTSAYGCDSTVITDITIITGISENVNTMDVSVYPNPTNGNLNVDLGSVQDKFIVTVIDMLGREILTQEFKNSNKAIVNFNNTATGVYQIFVTTNTSRFKAKVVRY